MSAPNTYTFDPAGTNPANLITSELHVLTPGAGNSFQFVVPNNAPFFGASLQLRLKKPDQTIIPLVEGTHYHLSHKFIAASHQCDAGIYGSVTFINNQTEGLLMIDTYRTLGGTWTIDVNQQTQILSDILRNPRVIAWEQVANLPYAFPPVNHLQDVASLVGADAIVTALNLIATTLAAQAGQTTIVLPAVTPSKSQIGLGRVQNYPVATLNELAAQTAGRYVTSDLVYPAVNAIVAELLQEHQATSMPTTGTYTAGRFVQNTAPHIVPYNNPSSPMNNQPCVIEGWIRLTTGSQHVRNVDWAEKIAFTLP